MLSRFVSRPKRIMDDLELLAHKTGQRKSFAIFAREANCDRCSSETIWRIPLLPLNELKHRQNAWRL